MYSCKIILLILVVIAASNHQIGMIVGSTESWDRDIESTLDKFKFGSLTPKGDWSDYQMDYDKINEYLEDEVGPSKPNKEYLEAACGAKEGNPVYVYVKSSHLLFEILCDLFKSPDRCTSILVELLITIDMYARFPIRRIQQGEKNIRIIDRIVYQIAEEYAERCSKYHSEIDFKAIENPKNLFDEHEPTFYRDRVIKFAEHMFVDGSGSIELALNPKDNSIKDNLLESISYVTEHENVYTDRDARHMLDTIEELARVAGDTKTNILSQDHIDVDANEDIFRSLFEEYLVRSCRKYLLHYYRSTMAIMFVQKFKKDILEHSGTPVLKHMLRSEKCLKFLGSANEAFGEFMGYLRKRSQHDSPEAADFASES